MDNQAQAPTVSISAKSKDPRRVFAQNDWMQGISDYNKVGGAYIWSQGIDYRTEPSQLRLLPQALPEAQGVFSDLGMFGQQVVGRTVIQGTAPNLIANSSFEVNTTGWTLGTGFSRSNLAAYQGAYSIQEVSVPTGYRGIALSGLEFGNAIPGALNINYFESSQNTVNYFGAKGFSTIRLPFTWERLQPSLGAPLDPTYKSYLDTMIGYAGAAGMKVILDCHNYGRYTQYLNGGITEGFTEGLTNLVYPYADYAQNGYIVLRNYGESLLGTFANPVAPAQGYAVQWTMQFNSRDTTFGGEGLYIRPMWQSDINCYNFAILNDGTNTWQLQQIINGTTTILASGTFGFSWVQGTTSHTFKIDVNQTTNGKINVYLDGSPLYTLNSINSSTSLLRGKVAFFAAGVHAQVSTLSLNVNGDTTSGGWQTNAIGTPAVPITQFAYFWQLMADAYQNNPNVLGFDTMNEPHDMPIPTTSSNYTPTVPGSLSGLPIRSIDIMKYTKDTVINQFNSTFISSLITFLAAQFNLTHIAISVPLDSNADFIANGSTPSPSSVESYFAAWCTAIHGAGLKILYRGPFCNMENIYNFPYKPNGAIPMGTTASAPTDGNTTWLGKLYSRIQVLGSNFESGDIFAPFPEQTTYAFNGDSFLPTTPSIQANYITFFESVPQVISAAFKNLSISGIVSNYTTNNYSELRSGYLPPSFVTTIGAQAVDYYGNYNNDGYLPVQYMDDLQIIYTQNGNTPLFLQEWADIYNASLGQTPRTAYLNSFYTAMAPLVNQGILTAFNYWGGWAQVFSDSSVHPEGLLVNNGSDTSPSWALNYNGVVLQSYFAAGAGATVSQMTQAAINAIRSVDTTHYIFCEIDEYAGGQNFVNNYGSTPTPWLSDSNNKLVYSFHYYFDNDHSGSYQQAFDSSNNTAISGDVSPIMEWAQNNSLNLHCGEYGVPAISAWQVCLTTFLGLCNTYNVWANYWAAGDEYTAVTSIQPTGSPGSYVDALQMAIVGLPANNAQAGSSSNFTTASGSGIAVIPYADYEISFWVNMATIPSGLTLFSLLGGSLTGPDLLVSPITIGDTAGAWSEVTATFNAGSYSTVFLKIANTNGVLEAYYDAFSLNQINSLASYVIGNKGNVYKRYPDASWVTLGQIANSHGNGLGYYGEDDYLYLMGDHTVGRYGPISSGTPNLVSDYLQSAGGQPTNTDSTLLVAASSQYYKKTSPTSALYNIASGELALEAFIKPTSLPAVGSSMTIEGVWKESGNERAWKLDVYGIAGFFGTGANSTLTISADTTESPIDSACSGITGTNQLSASNASFAVGQKILIIQMQGTNAGIYQMTTIQGYDNTNGLITTQDSLTVTYNSTSPNTAQVRVIPQYSSVTVQPGITYSAKPWNGSTGGILSFLCDGAVQIDGHLSGDALGFRQQAGPTAGNSGLQGEGYAGPPVVSTAPNGNGGGGGQDDNQASAAGGGGSYGTAGLTGGNYKTASGGQAGFTIGATDLSTLFMGGAGGRAGASSQNNNLAPTGHGGAIILIGAVTLQGAGSITSNGGIGATANTSNQSGSAGGSGGPILIFQQTNAGTPTIQALGGDGGAFQDTTETGGYGGVGIVHVNYYNSDTLVSTPTLTDAQSSVLVTTPSTQLRLGISNDGTAFEYLTQVLQNYQIGQWDRVQVSWLGSSSTASFYEGGVLIGTAIGTKTAIFASSSADFAIGANIVTSTTYTNFLDAKVDDVRVWDTTLTQAQFAANNVVNLNGVAAGLVGEWFMSASPDDYTGANNVVGQNSPTYVTDVPFYGTTTRGDQDQTGGGTGQTYTLPTVLTESAKQSFVPLYDPQKSLQITIAAKGTGNWTLVVHDGLNELCAQVTVLNANLPSSGAYEFVYPQVFRPVKGATYHLHLYSTVDDGTVVTSADSDPTTIEFTTFYQFLVDDIYHPAMQMGNLEGIGNERYLAVTSAAGGDGYGNYNGQGYNPHRLSFPAGWRVRCMTLWRGSYAIGCWMGNQISDFDQGIVFIWDGTSATYTDYFFVPQGGVNAMFAENGILYIIAGRKGHLIEYTGDLMAEYGYDIVNLAKRIPRIETGSYAEVAPGAITYYGSLLRIGMSINATTEEMARGIYTWGSYYSQYPKSLSFDYPVPTNNTGTTVSVGLMLPVGGDLLVFYQDGTSYGVGNIAEDNPPQASGTIEGLITDYNAVFKHKELLTVRADHLPLATGANVDVKYKLDYESSWHNEGIANQEVGDVFTRLPVTITQNDTEQQTGQNRILQIGLDMYASNGVSPVVIEHSQLTDLLVTETDESAVTS